MKMSRIIVWLLALLALTNSTRLNLRNQRGYVVEEPRKKK